MSFQKLRARLSSSTERNGFAVSNITIILFLITDIKPEILIFKDLHKATIRAVNSEAKGMRS
jgi:hypothetical protein